MQTVQTTVIIEGLSFMDEVLDDSWELQGDAGYRVFVVTGGRRRKVAFLPTGTRQGDAERLAVALRGPGQRVEVMAVATGDILLRRPRTAGNG